MSMQLFLCQAVHLSHSVTYVVILAAELDHMKWAIIMCLNELPLRDISCRSQQQVTDSFPTQHSSHPPTSLMTDDIFSNYLLRPFFALLVAPSLHMYMCDVNTLVVCSTRSSIQPPLVSSACLSPLVKVGRIATSVLRRPTGDIFTPPSSSTSHYQHVYYMIC